MRKKKQRLVAIVIATLVSISLIASGFVWVFSDYGLNNKASLANSGSIEQSLQSQADSLVQALENNPDDANIWLNLANTYYDLGAAYLQSAPAKAADSFKKAVEAYQIVLKNKKDVNIIVDMATAAYYAGENDLADKSFQEALTLKPDFYNGLLNYGIFLMNAKNDYEKAIDQWHKALATNPPNEEKERLQNLIAFAQGKIQESYDQKSNSLSGNPGSGGK